MLAGSGVRRRAPGPWTQWRFERRHCRPPVAPGSALWVAGQVFAEFPDVRVVLIERTATFEAHVRTIPAPRDAAEEAELLGVVRDASPVHTRVHIGR